MSLPEQLQRFAELLERGLITRDEYDEQKARLLAESRYTPINSGRWATPTASGPWAVAQPSLEDGPIQLGAYELSGQLGIGGMGAVYQGRHVVSAAAVKQGGDVAVKVMHPHFCQDSEFRERFKREAEVGMRLEHPALVNVLDLIVDGTVLALVCELVHGDPLLPEDDEETEPLEVDRGLELFEQVVAGIAYAHAQGIIHRDIKPDNILIGSDGQAKILDFGIAKDVGGSVTVTQGGGALGSGSYMAPEQHNDASKIDYRADIYAVGITFYEAFAGGLPYGKDIGAAAVLAKKLLGQLTPLSEFRPHLPPALTAIIDQAIATDPDDRFATAAEMLDSIRAARIELGLLESSGPDASPEAPGAAGSEIDGPAGPPGAEPDQQADVQSGEPDRFVQHDREPPAAAAEGDGGLLSDGPREVRTSYSAPEDLLLSGFVRPPQQPGDRPRFDTDALEELEPIGVADSFSPAQLGSAEPPRAAPAASPSAAPPVRPTKAPEPVATSSGTDSVDWNPGADRRRAALIVAALLLPILFLAWYGLSRSRGPSPAAEVVPQPALVDEAVAPAPTTAAPAAPDSVVDEPIDEEPVAEGDAEGDAELGDPVGDSEADPPPAATPTAAVAEVLPDDPEPLPPVPPAAEPTQTPARDEASSRLAASEEAPSESSDEAATEDEQPSLALSFEPPAKSYLVLGAELPLEVRVRGVDEECRVQAVYELADQGGGESAAYPLRRAGPNVYMGRLKIQHEMGSSLRYFIRARCGDRGEVRTTISSIPIIN